MKQEGAAKKRPQTTVAPSSSPRAAAAAASAAQQEPPFKWKTAALLVAISVAMLGIANKLVEDSDALQQNLDPKPQPASTPSHDHIPRGDDANPNAKYRVRSGTPLVQPLVMNASKDWPTSVSELCVTEERLSDPMTVCIPSYHRCTRVVVDNFITDAAAESVVAMMKRVIRSIGNGGGSGPVSLVDLNLGVVSMQDKFVSLTHALRRLQAGKKPLPLSLDDVDLYYSLIRKIHAYVSEAMFCASYPCADDVDRERARKTGRAHLFVAAPSFFSQIGGPNLAKTINDEYWHSHVDRDQYGTFAVTTLLYLNTMKDAVALDSFEGGQFEFGGVYPATVEPRKARLSMFTSGEEHPHWVGPVTEGYRYTLTTAFTCLPPSSTEDGSLTSFTIDESGSSSSGGVETSFLNALKKAISKAG